MIRRHLCVRGVLVVVSVALLAPRHQAEAHRHSPPWAEVAELDGGLHISVMHPRLIRVVGPVDVQVAVRNIAGEHSITVESVRYLPEKGARADWRRFDRTLPTQVATFEAYGAETAALHEAAHRADSEAVARLTKRSRALLKELSADVLTDRYHVPAELIPGEAGSAFRMTVEIRLIEDGVGRVVRRDVEIPVHPPLPTGPGDAPEQLYDLSEGEFKPSGQTPPSRRLAGSYWWVAGDQHLHTTYSLDAFVLHGTEENAADYAAAAELMGMAWVIITDHSNVHATWGGTEYYTAAQFDAGTAETAGYTAAHDFVALYGQEMGAGDIGFWSLPSHYLAYPFSVDSTGYLANPSSGLLYGLANCEDEQVIIDRVNTAGGFGFIAHPFDSGTLAFAEWDFDNGATGWSGMEIWSDTDGEIKGSDDEAFAHWHAMLNDIAAPQHGQLAARPGFPNAFPVGLGNSDAHEVGLIGATFTYAWMPSVSRPEVTGSLSKGRCVASNGPLLFATVNGARIGEVALLLAGDNEPLLTLVTTSEFGPVGDYEFTLYVNGTAYGTIAPLGTPDYSVVLRLVDLDLAPPDKFITVRVDSTDGVRHAMTNPVWLQFTIPGDADADGVVNLTDWPMFAGCVDGPGAERMPVCDIMDFDRDRDVDMVDAAAFQRAFDSP